MRDHWIVVPQMCVPLRGEWREPLYGNGGLNVQTKLSSYCFGARIRRAFSRAGWRQGVVLQWKLVL